MTDLIERLRKFCTPGHAGLIDEAADELERLQQELATLRQELETVRTLNKSLTKNAMHLSEEMQRLRKIEQAAVWACDSPQWRGDDFDNCMYALDAALKGEK